MDRRINCQGLGQRAFAISYLDLASGAAAGAPEFRQDVKIVVLTENELRVLLIFIRLHGSRQNDGSLAGVLVLNDPSQVGILPVKPDDVLAGVHGLVTDG